MISIEPKEFLARVDNFIATIKAAGGKVSKSTEGLPNQFGIIIDGWKEGTTPYLLAILSHRNLIWPVNKFIKIKV